MIEKTAQQAMFFVKRNQTSDFYSSNFVLVSMAKRSRVEPTPKISIAPSSFECRCPDDSPSRPAPS